MAITRHETGHSAPRLPFLTSSSSTPKTTTTTRTTKTKTKTKTTGAKPTANTSKPRAKATATATGTGRGTTTTGGGVVKNKRKVTVGDRIKGAVEKAVGVVEGRPGKKGAGTKKMRGTDGKGSHRVTKA